jgi:hypothetical protein
LTTDGNSTVKRARKTAFFVHYRESKIAENLGPKYNL